MWAIVRYYVEKNVNRKSLYHTDELTTPDELEDVKGEMLEVLASLLNSSSNSIDEVLDKNDNFSYNKFSSLNRSDDGHYR